MELLEEVQYQLNAKIFIYICRKNFSEIKKKDLTGIPDIGYDVEGIILEAI